MHEVDQVLLWLQDRLSAAWGPGAAAAALPVLALVAYVMAAVLLRRLLPPLVRLLIAPLVVLVLGLVALTVLTADFTIATAFRTIRRPPPALAFATGDLAVAGAMRAQRGVRLLARRYSQRAGVGPGLVLLLMIGAFAWWSAGYCARAGGDGCRPPLVAWFHLVNGLFG
jgi:hypothetical protein